MVNQTEDLLMNQLSVLRSGFDRLFFALQTGFARLISAMQVLSGNLMKAFVRPESFAKAITGQAPGRGKAAGGSTNIFSAIDEFVGNLREVIDEPDAADPNAPKSSTANKQADGFGGTMKTMFKTASKPLGAMAGQFAALGPQAMLAAVALAPIQELLTGLLEPLEPITEIFGVFGTLLSQMFLPIMDVITPFLLQLIPLFDQIGKALAPLITLLFSFSTIGVLIAIITPLIPTLILIADAFGQIMTALSPLITLFSNIVNWGMGVVFETLGKAFSGLGISAESVTNAIKKFAEFIDKVTQMIQGFLDFMKGDLSWSDYQAQGKRVTGGGDDEEGWF